jgi:tetratricopeptide (TPR) repeat protein
LVPDIRAYLIAAYKEKGQIIDMLNQAMYLYRDEPSNKDSRDLVVAHLETDKNWSALSKAATQWTQWQAKDPDNWRFLALAQGNLGEPKAAAQSLLKAAEIEKNKPSSWFMAAEALEKSGDREAAKTAYTKVIDLEPENEKAESAILRITLEGISESRNRNREPS